MSFRDDFRQHALGLEGAWLDHSWDIEGDVYKTAKGKIFLLVSDDAGAASATVKLLPDEALAALALQFVREARWPRRWVTARATNEAERDIVLVWIRRSYEIVSGARAMHT